MQLGSRRSAEDVMLVRFYFLLKQRERRQRTFATHPSNAMLAYTFLFVVFATPATAAWGLPGPRGPPGPGPPSLPTCRIPPRVANGRVVHSSSGFAVYECNPGYLTPKYPIMTCCTGVWSAAVFCEPSPSKRFLCRSYVTNRAIRMSFLLTFI